MTAFFSKRGRLLLGFLGLVLVIVPVVGAHGVIAYNTRMQAGQTLADLAEDGIARAEEALDDGLAALTDLSIRGVGGCTDADLNAMRHAVFANYSIKEVGVINGSGQILCNHMGDSVPVKALSPPLPSRTPGVTLQVVALGDDAHTGVMLDWLASERGGLSAIVPGEALTVDLLPANLRATAFGRMSLLNGASIGTIPEDAPPPPVPPKGEIISAERVSQRYPIAMHVTAPLATFLEQDQTLLTYVDVGGTVMGGLVLGLIFFALRGRSDPLGELAQALRRGEFIPYYQPLVDVRTGRLAGCEVLMRWRKPDNTVLLPAAFIGIAEASGLAREMTFSLLKLVRSDLEEAFADRRHLKIAVNLFHQQFDTIETVKDVETVFGGSAIRFDQLVFEVTERQPLSDVEQARRVIRRLQELGTRVALDDVGAGHAGLAYLHQLKVNILKIDKLFVDTIGSDSGPVPIVDSLIKLAHDLGMEVVAEGVETFAQLQYLRGRGADLAQGYFFAPPLPSGAFLRLVEAFDPFARQSSPVLMQAMEPAVKAPAKVA